MPRNYASRLYMAAQVQGRTLERQADGLRQQLCQLAGGQASLEDVLGKVEGMRVQLDYAEALAREFSRVE